jgi:hypothetical protein
MIQYAAAVLISREFADYWMPAFAGMTKWYCNVHPCTDTGCFAFASIWPIASTTASKVSMVEACRAL